MLRWHEIEEGDEAPVHVEGPITRTDIVRYAGAAGDFNPVHHDEEFARSLGLPSVFAMGMLQAGFLSHVVEDWVGLENLREFRVRFGALVWPGEKLTVTARVVRKFETAQERRIEASIGVTNEAGEVKVSGSAIAAVG